MCDGFLSATASGSMRTFGAAEKMLSAWAYFGRLSARLFFCHRVVGKKKKCYAMQ